MLRAWWITGAFVLTCSIRVAWGQEAPAAEAAPDPAARAAAAEPEGVLPADWMSALKWRCIGPANMGGRITAIAVSRQDPVRWWAATASGGLLRTTNDGMTFEHQFDREAVVSIGDVEVAPSNH